MVERFENLTGGISRIYKCIQKIKKNKTTSFGLKGTHVMCIYYLNRNPEGLTAADLCNLCQEDKAGISRILADLEQKNYIRYNLPPGEKKYRAKAVLTEDGQKDALKMADLIMHITEACGEGLTEEERDTFYRVLFRIADNLEQILTETTKN